MKGAAKATHMKRDKGLRRASVRDFHSFRVTWIALALSMTLTYRADNMMTGLFYMRLVSLFGELPTEAVQASLIRSAADLPCAAQPLR
jgi:hypothetical protein